MSLGFGLFLGFPPGRSGRFEGTEPGTERRLAGKIEVNPQFEANIQATHNLAGTMNANPDFEGGLSPLRILKGRVDTNPDFTANLQATVGLRGTIQVNPEFEGDIDEVSSVTLMGTLQVNPIFEADMEEPVSYEPETNALVAAMTVPPSDARKAAIDAVIVSLKTTSVWEKLDRLFMFAAHDEQASLLDWKDPSRVGTKVGTPTFFTNLGFVRTVNGQRIDIPFPVGENYALTHASAGVLTGAETGENFRPIDTDRSSGGILTLTLRNTPDIQSSLNDATTSTVARTLGAALYSVARLNGTKQFYRNGSALSSAGVAATSLPVATNVRLFGADFMATGTIRCFYMGAYLDLTDVTDLSDAIATYIASLSADYDSAADSLFAAMTTPPDDTRKGIINETILDLKAAGLWEKLDQLTVFAAHDEQAGLINWKDPAKIATKFGTPTFTVDTGIKVNANEGYSYTAPLGGTNFTQNDSSVGVCLNAMGASTLITSLGTTGSGSICQATFETPSLTWYHNEGTGNIVNLTVSAGDVITMIRRAASASTKRLYQNTTSRSTPTLASSAIPVAGQRTQNFFRSGLFDTTTEIRYAFNGAALTDTELGNLISIMAAYYAAL